MKKQIYTIAFDKERSSKNSYDVNFGDAKATIDIRWIDCCTEEEALCKFDELIWKQTYDLGDKRSYETWRAIRLYDGSGRQIRQES